MNKKDILCPECNYRLKLGHHLHQGQRMTCPGCESKLVVVSLKPIELDLARQMSRTAASSEKRRAVEIPCPECDNLVKLNAYVHTGHHILCGNCNVVLEVVSANPVELDVAQTVKFKHHYRNEFDEQRRTTKRVNTERRKQR